MTTEMVGYVSDSQAVATESHSWVSKKYLCFLNTYLLWSPTLLFISPE